MNNGKKGSLKACKEDGEAIENGRIVPPNVYGNNGSSSSSSFETKSFRFRSPSRTQDNNNTNLSQFGSVLFSHQSDTNLHNHEPNNKHHQTQTQTQTQTQAQTQRPETSPSASSSPNRGGDMLLQWGHKKRSRVSRTEIRALTDEPLSSSSSAQVRQALKLKRRAVTCATPDKLPTTSMPPPPPPLLALPSTAASSSSSSGRSRKVETSGLLPTRYHLPTKFHIFLYLHVLFICFFVFFFFAFSSPFLFLNLINSNNSGTSFLLVLSFAQMFFFY